MIETIQLDNANPTTFLGYTHKGITITPEPPQVGKTSTITLSLQMEALAFWEYRRCLREGDQGDEGGPYHV